MPETIQPTEASESTEPVRIALIGPAADQPCGIADYVRRLEKAMATRCRLVAADFRRALADPEVAGCRALLVHYERSLVPGPGYLADLSARHPGKVFVVPHEVYRADPFAFPYESLQSAFPPVLWLKRLLYRWRHRDYGRERALQRRGYHAHRVIPMSREGAGILREAAGSRAERILDTVPHARFDLPAVPKEGRPAVLRTELFPGKPRLIMGIFGFLNPGLDYGSALDLLGPLGKDAALLLLGGERTGYHGPGGERTELEAEARRRGIPDRMRVTGYIPEEDLADYLAACDLFLCPMRFKSNSGSLLHLFRLGKPILAPDLPLTRYLADEGAPLDLYRGQPDLLEKAAAIMAGARSVPEDRYTWDFGRVAEAYLGLMRAGTAPEGRRQ